jgi:hypothetical protein
MKRKRTPDLLGIWTVTSRSALAFHSFHPSFLSPGTLPAQLSSSGQPYGLAIFQAQPADDGAHFLPEAVALLQQ